MNFKEIIIEAIADRKGKDKTVIVPLERVNIRLDGKFLSSITFCKNLDTRKKQIQIPIIKPGSLSLRIPSPIISGLKKGYHNVALEFLDSSSKNLEAVRMEFAIFDWMREGEEWSIIPVEVLLSGFEHPIPATIYSKEQQLSESHHSDTNHLDKITVTSVKVSTSSMKEEPDKRRMKHLEVALETLDDYFLKAIEITIDGNLRFKFTAKEEIRLMKKYRYILKLPCPLPLDLSLGRHSLILKLLGRVHLEPVEKEQELLVFAKEFACWKREREQANKLP